MPVALGIIGYPINHSISPIFQQAALDHIGFHADYRASEVPPEGLAGFLKTLREEKYLGINVTVPHKVAVIPYLDEMDPTATAAGAVNTILNLNGKLIGHNTDTYGFLQGLKIERRFECRDKRVLVLGAGGAARGVLQALIQERVIECVIANRTLHRAERLAATGLQMGIDCKSIGMAWEELSLAAVNADLIVNCTTIGMAHTLNEGDSPLQPQQIPPGALVCDLVYNPLVTPLIRAAARAGADTLGGIHMLVYQGAASFELWLGSEAPVEVMMQAAVSAMGDDD